MRWVFRVVFTLALLVLVLAGLVFLLPADRIASLAAAEFQSATGRNLTVAAPVRPSFWPQLGVRTGKVTVGNADWGGPDPLLEAESLSIGIDFASLVSGPLRIRKIEAIRPKLVLERAKDGRVNWDLGAGSGDGQRGAQGGGFQAASLDRVAISGGSLRFIDHAGGRVHLLDAIDAELSAPDFRGAADMTLSARLNNQPLSVAGRISEMAPFLAGKVVPVELSLDSGKAHLTLAGRLGTAPLVADGRLDAALGDLAEVAALAGQPRPELPQFLRPAVNLAGQLTLTEAGSLHLRDGVVQLGPNTLAVAADMTPGADRPKLVAQIAARTLTLSGQAASGTSAGRGAGWPAAPIDVSALGLLDAELALSAERILLGPVTLGASRANVVLDRGRAVIDLRDVAAYDGKVSGDFVVNGRKGLSVGARLTVASMALKPLLGDLGVTDRLVGTGDARIEFLGVGGSVDAIMRSLKGNGNLSFGQGQIEGLDLAGMVRHLDTSYVGEGAKTVYDSIAATFTITDGKLQNDDLVFAAPLVNATGKGQVDLGARRLDYRLMARALGGADGTGGLRVPVKVTGPWDDPDFALDLQAIADEKVAAEKAKLEEKAKAKLQEKAASELGVVQQEGETLEDAAKRKLADEAAKALGKLLGGN